MIIHFCYLTVAQGVYSRTNKFDGNLFPIFTVEDLNKQVTPPILWLNIQVIGSQISIVIIQSQCSLNISLYLFLSQSLFSLLQHDIFFSQRNLSMRNFVLSVSKKVVVKYISSPEVNFLKGIAARFNPKITKLVFRFMGSDEIEPSTNQTYGTLQKNLTFIKTFASGIMVPKNYIWPVDATSYLLPSTTLVASAHKAGLEVFASDFTNDVPLSYDYSYDPLAEYLRFIDNGDFSVDGVLSDFPITPSEAVGKLCFFMVRMACY